MALKRKRSSPSLSSPSNASDITTNSHLPSFYTHSKPAEPLHFKPMWSSPTYADQPDSLHLNSRTRKRHRDDRPDEQQVYSNTITKLYEAQRQHPHASPVYSQLSTSPPIYQPQPQRSTLHSFWRISQPPSIAPMVLDSAYAPAQSTLDTRCEDCERPLRNDDAMEMDEDTLERETSCESCKRCVCDRCAILGDARICLACAGSCVGRQFQ